MNKIVKQNIRVMASVYPTPHNRIWLSSGRVPLDMLSKKKDYINFLVLVNKDDSVVFGKIVGKGL